MPRVHFLNRRWNFGSDDLVYPGILEIAFRSIWLTPQAVYYFRFNDIYKCPDTTNLHIFYIGFLAYMTVIIIVQLFIVIISAQGTITDTQPRRHITKFLSVRLFLILFEMAWSIVGTVFIAQWRTSRCSYIVFATVLVNLIFSVLSLVIIITILIFLFDPFSHVDTNDVSAKIRIIENYYLKLCCFCCLNSGIKKSENYANSFQQISRLMSMFFVKSDLTLSDIGAGIMLINNKTLPQLPREFHTHKVCKKTNIDEIARWMNTNEAAHFVRYAVAIYANKKYAVKTKLDSTVEAISLTSDAILRERLSAFKNLAQCKEEDIIYANFTAELFLTPFSVVIDHFKKTVVITIRGTLSMTDLITDLSASFEYFDIGDLQKQPCHFGILKTAKHINQIIREKNLLANAFERNPDYSLLVTGHSLGGGVATILSMKLKKDYPDIRCIAYCPPGGMVSDELAEYTKSFVLSVVIGDDIVPRLGVHSVHSLKADILKEIWETNDPKYKIYWNYFTGLMRREFTEDIRLKGLITEPVVKCVSFAVDENDKDNQEDIPNLIRLTKRKLAKRESIVEIEDFKFEAPSEKIKTKDEAYKLIIMMKKFVRKTYPELILPGNVLYIYRACDTSINESRWWLVCSKLFFWTNFFKKKIDYNFRWAQNDEFSRIIISRRMIVDHLTENLEDALNYLTRQND